MHILRLRPSDRRRSESHDASHYGTTGVGSFLQNLTKALEIDMVRFPIGTGVKRAAMIESQTEVTAMFVTIAAGTRARSTPVHGGLCRHGSRGSLLAFGCKMTLTSSWLSGFLALIKTTE